MSCGRTCCIYELEDVDLLSGPWSVEWGQVGAYLHTRLLRHPPGAHWWSEQRRDVSRFIDWPHWLNFHKRRWHMGGRCVCGGDVCLRLYGLRLCPDTPRLSECFSGGGEESWFTVIHLSLICNDCSICCLRGGLGESRARLHRLIFSHVVNSGGTHTHTQP